MSGWAREIRTDRVTGLTDTCPECKVPMAATGNLYFDHPPLSRWAVEYFCERCRELYTIYARDRAAMIDAIAREETSRRDIGGQR